MKTNNFNHPVFSYIINAINNPDDDNFDLKTDKEKLTFLIDIFKSEQWYDYNQKYYKGNIFKCFESWLMGLPSYFKIDFEYWQIDKIAIAWNSYKETDSEKRKEKIINNWFAFITQKTFQLLRKYKIDY